MNNFYGKLIDQFADKGKRNQAIVSEANRLREKLSYASADISKLKNRQFIGNNLREVDNSLISKLRRKLTNNQIVRPEFSAELGRDEKFVKQDLNWLYEAQLQSRVDGGLEGGYQWRRLAEIYQIVQLFKITSVIEFGSGTSSYLFADLATKFLTFEEQEFWQERLFKFCPSRLKERLSGSAILAKRQITCFENEAVTSYEGSFKHVLNSSILSNAETRSLIYIDGPYSGRLNQDILECEPAEFWSDLDGVKDYNMPNIDVLELVSKAKAKPTIICVDGRRPTVRLLSEKLGDYEAFFSSNYNLIREKFPNFRPPLYHTLFVHKDYAAAELKE